MKNLFKGINFPVIKALPLQIPDFKKKKFKKSRLFFWQIKEFFTFRRKWEVQEVNYIWSEYLQCFIYIPLWFIFDGASVPKLLYGLFSPNGSLLYGALPHDLGYKFEGLFLYHENTGLITFKKFSQKELDTIFRGLNIQETGFKKSTKIANLGLKIGSGSTWKKYRKENLDPFSVYPYLKTGDKIA